jgi:hypothetical protein
MKTYAITASHKDTGTVYHESVAALNVFDAIKLFDKALAEKHLITLERIDCLSLDLLEE